MIAGIQKRMRLQDDIIMVMIKEIYSIDGLYMFVCKLNRIQSNFIYKESTDWLQLFMYNKRRYIFEV